MRWADKVVACTLLIANICLAGDKVQLGPAPSWVLPPSTAEAPAPDGAPMQFLAADQQVRITDNSVAIHIASRVRINAPQGMGMVTPIRLVWKPDSDALTVHRLTVTHEGQVRNLAENADAFTVLRREDMLERSILTGTLTATLQPAGLQVGDVLDMAYTVERKDPVVADHPDGTYILPPLPMASARLRAIWPESLPVRWKPSAQMPAATPVKRDGWEELSFAMSNAPALLQPTMAPPRFNAVRRVELSTFEDWSHVSRRLAPLYEKASTLASGSPLKAEIDRIRKENNTAEDQAAAALRLAQDKIRYVLLAMNDGGLVPATADETWQRRFGDCKAKTVLLLALLHGLDIQAEPVAVSTTNGDGMNERLPGISSFDHVMVRARIGDKDYWLDGTRTGDRALADLQPVLFRFGLPLTSAGSDLVEIPLVAPKGYQWDKRVLIDATGGVDKPAPFRGEVIYHGDAARMNKLALDRVPAANRDEAQGAFWRQQYRNLEIKEAKSEFDDATNTMTGTVSGTIQLAFDQSLQTYEPVGMTPNGGVDFTRPTGTDAQAPYRVQFPMSFRNLEVIRLPVTKAPFELLGTDFDQTFGGGRFQRRAKIEGSQFEVEGIYSSLVPEFPASEVAAAQQGIRELARNKVYLKKPAGEGN